MSVETVIAELVRVMPELGREIEENREATVRKILSPLLERDRHPLSGRFEQFKWLDRMVDSCPNYNGTRQLKICGTTFSPADSSDPAGGTIVAILPALWGGIGMTAKYLVIIQSEDEFWQSPNSECE